MIRQSLNIAASQQLQLTPKLQQAIHMLQLSTQELTQEIQTIAESNIMLDTEVDESDDSDSTVEEAASKETALKDISIKEETDSAANTNEVEITISVGENELPDNMNSWKSNDAEYSPLENSKCADDDLSAYLSWQLEVSHASDREKIIGAAIIDAINDDGFLELDITEIQAGLQNTGESFNLKEIEIVLHLIQSFDPAGIAARDVREALLLQLNTLPSDTPALLLAKKVVSDHLHLLAEHHYIKLKRLCKTSKEQLEKALKLIQTLNPRPGNILTTSSNIDNVIPDLIVQKVNKSWVISLRNDALPKLHINNYYMKLLNNCSENINQQLIHNHLQEARWLIKCLHNRNETLLRVAVCIIKYQKSFLEYGAGAMKPLVLRDIAETLGMHQSTVSRITTRKYIQTPQGTFELKYFFSSHVKTNYGRTCSSMAIRAYLQEMIKQENVLKPLSDEAIAKNLLQLGIKVARRTITKYREAMAIPPANKRRKLVREEL